MEGRSIKTSKQSIIIVVFFPKENWKHIGIVRHNSSLSDHLMRGDNLTSWLVPSRLQVTQEIQRRERWVPRKGAQGEMGREKTKEEDVVFSPSPFPSSSALPPCYIKTTGDESDLTSITVNHAVNVLETVERETPNRKARSCNGTWSLSLIKTITNSRNNVSVLLFRLTNGLTKRKVVLSTSKPGKWCPVISPPGSFATIQVRGLSFLLYGPTLSRTITFLSFFLR